MKATDKMVAGETETEYLPIQVFLDDFFSGQTYALEVAFATVQYKHTTQSGFTEKWAWLMGELISKFLTKNVKKMVGYAVSQSKLYGLKTERYTTLKAVVSIVEEYFNCSDFTASQVKMVTTSMLLQALLDLPHVKTALVANAHGDKVDQPALEVCGKKYPLTNYWDTFLTSVQGALNNYGERVKEFEGENVDWKALSHAIRITYQVLELSQKGTLTFPNEHAELLRSIKNGEVSLNEATEALNDAFSKIDDAVNASVLQEKTPLLESEFYEWKMAILVDLYKDQMELALSS
jgi:hypothetical protein